MKKNHLVACLTSLAIASTLGIQVAQATEVFQTTDVTFGYTNKAKFDPVYGTGTSDEKQTVMRLEHLGVHSFGDNYFSIDSYRGNEAGNIPALSAAGLNAGSFADNTKYQYLILWLTRGSLLKLVGAKPGAGLIKDVYAEYRMERGSYANFHSDNVGVSFDLNLPGFTWFQTEFLARKSHFTGATADDRKTSLFWHTVAILPFDVGGLSFTFMPLLQMNFSKGPNETDTFIQPDLWLKIKNTPFEVGYRHEYHKFKNYKRTSPTAMVKWNF
jgi:hypothetical protein